MLHSVFFFLEKFTSVKFNMTISIFHLLHKALPGIPQIIWPCASLCCLLERLNCSLTYPFCQYFTKYITLSGAFPLRSSPWSEPVFVQRRNRLMRQCFCHIFSCRYFRGYCFLWLMDCWLYDTLIFFNYDLKSAGLRFFAPRDIFPRFKKDAWMLQTSVPVDAWKKTKKTTNQCSSFADVGAQSLHVYFIPVHQGGAVGSRSGSCGLFTLPLKSPHIPSSINNSVTHRNLFVLVDFVRVFPEILMIDYVGS